MALTEDAKLKWTETLLELELMGEHDSIEAHTAGDYWEFMSGQKRGNFFFTNEKFIFVSGLGFSNFSIDYKNIREIQKTFVGPFIPTGIKVAAVDPASGKTKKYKCSVMKRKEWMELLSKKSGV